jgi:hypothetical protein
MRTSSLGNANLFPAGGSNLNMAAPHPGRRGSIDRRTVASHRESFDHPDPTFEPRIDGFRALAYVNRHHCRFVSRNGHVFKAWPQLAQEIA